MSLCENEWKIERYEKEEKYEEKLQNWKSHLRIKWINENNTKINRASKIDQKEVEEIDILWIKVDN